MSGLLNQAQNLATQAVNTASDLTNKAVNSQAAATATEGAKALGAQAASAAGAAATTIGSLATQAQEHASAVAPSIIPPPAGGAGVDTRGDLSPTNEADRAKLDKLFAERAEAKELQEKGILKGQPGDALAGKRAELEKSMIGDRLEKEIAQRPAPEELVKKGILNPDEAPATK